MNSNVKQIQLPEEPSNYKSSEEPLVHKTIVAKILLDTVHVPERKMVQYTYGPNGKFTVNGYGGKSRTYGMSVEFPPSRKSIQMYTYCKMSVRIWNNTGKSRDIQPYHVVVDIENADLPHPVTCELESSECESLIYAPQAVTHLLRLEVEQIPNVVLVCPIKLILSSVSVSFSDDQ